MDEPLSLVVSESPRVVFKKDDEEVDEDAMDGLLGLHLQALDSLHGEPKKTGGGGNFRAELKRPDLKGLCPSRVSGLRHLPVFHLPEGLLSLVVAESTPDAGSLQELQVRPVQEGDHE